MLAICNADLTQVGVAFHEPPERLLFNRCLADIEFLQYTPVMYPYIKIPNVQYTEYDVQYIYS